MIFQKMRYSSLAIVFCLTLTVFLLHTPAACNAFEIDIDVAPNTLNIQSQGQVVTVHTSIAYSSVNGGSVSLNDIEIDWWKADAQGNFVAKFLMSEVKALADSGDLVVPGQNTLLLEGETIEGTSFNGTQEITVINVMPSGFRIK